MNINITLIGQMLTFAILVWFTMKYVWPPLMDALKEREKKIADGLAAAEKGHAELETARQNVSKSLEAAKHEAFQIIEQANKRAAQIVDASKITAEEEGRRILATSRAEIAQEYQQAREELRCKLAAVAITGAEKILERSVDQSAHVELLEKLAAEI